MLSRSILLFVMFAVSGVLYAGADPLERGRQVYMKCIMCHGPDGSTGLGKPLVKQSRKEIVQKLRAYRAGHITGSTNATLMTFRARNLTDDEIDAVARYVEEVLILGRNH